MSSSASIGVDPNGYDVNATLFRGLICSLLYLTAKDPKIMFATILCARYQANPKESHLLAVKKDISLPKAYTQYFFMVSS